MSGTTDELRQIHQELDELVERSAHESVQGALDALIKAAEEVGESWSGSWIGYQSRVYYRGFQPPPPGQHFSSEWGLSRSADGWEEYSAEDIRSAIDDRSAGASIDAAESLAEEAKLLFDAKRDQFVSILEVIDATKSDGFLKAVLKDVAEIKYPAPSSYLQRLAPTGLTTRDSLAIHQGAQAPPHAVVGCEAGEIVGTFAQCRNLGKLTLKAASHLERLDRQKTREDRIGTNVFIGHGRSEVWRELKDFVQDRLQLPWDEFNRVPVAGVTNIARLSEMLDDAAIAFIVMTPEDEQADGTYRARENVVHEAGLFQGRLGFTKAIILLEEGCEEFSNVEGLGQIRFPRENIGGAFEDIRKVVEREGVM